MPNPRADWRKDLKELGWEKMLSKHLGIHGILTESMVSDNTDKERRIVRRHFNRLVRAGKARHDLFRGQSAIIVPLEKRRL